MYIQHIKIIAAICYGAYDMKIGCYFRGMKNVCASKAIINRSSALRFFYQINFNGTKAFGNIPSAVITFIFSIWDLNHPYPY